MGKMLKFCFKKFCWLVLTKYCQIQSNSTNWPKEPFILCSNHRSHLDTPALLLASGKSFDDFYMLAAKDYFQTKQKMNKILPHLLNLIFVERNANTQETLRLTRECREVKQKNKNLIIYPEGTRSLNACMDSFKAGVVFMATKLSMPIVPAAITGTDIAMAKNKKWVSPTLIKINFGEPLYQPCLNLTSRKTIMELTRTLKNNITQLLHENINSENILKSSIQKEEI